jgi:hypothetical protein
VRIRQSLQFFYESLRCEELRFYKPYRGKNPVKSLEVHPKINEARLAKWWDLKPWEFRALDREQRAELHAIYSVEMEIESYYASESIRRSEAPAK